MRARFPRGAKGLGCGEVEAPRGSRGGVHFRRRLNLYNTLGALFCSSGNCQAVVSRKCHTWRLIVWGITIFRDRNVDL
jgi:hypothetical protein